MEHLLHDLSFSSPENLNSQKRWAVPGWELNPCSCLCYCLSAWPATGLLLCLPGWLRKTKWKPPFFQQESVCHCFLAINQKGKNKELCPLQCLDHYPPTEGIKKHHSLSRPYGKLRFHISQTSRFRICCPPVWVQNTWSQSSGPMTVCPQEIGAGSGGGAARCGVVLRGSRPGRGEGSDSGGGHTNRPRAVSLLEVGHSPQPWTRPTLRSGSAHSIAVSECLPFQTRK